MIGESLGESNLDAETHVSFCAACRSRAEGSIHPQLVAGAVEVGALETTAYAEIRKQKMR